MAAIRRQSEFGKKRGEEKVDLQSIANQLIAGPENPNGQRRATVAKVTTMGSRARTTGALQDAVQNAYRLSEQLRLRNEEMENQQARMMAHFTQRVDEITDEDGSRDRRFKVSETTRKALKQVEELSKFLGLDKVKPVLGTVSSMRLEDPDIDLDQEIEKNMKTLGLQPAEYFTSALSQLENLSTKLVDDGQAFTEAMEVEERLLYEDAAEMVGAMKILAADCICGAKLNETIEAAEFAATTRTRHQCTDMFSKVTMGCTNMIRGLERLLLDKEKIITDLTVSNEMLVERAMQSRKDYVAMEQQCDKKIESLFQQMELIAEQLNNSNAGSPGPTSVGNNWKQSIMQIKGFSNDINSAFMNKKEFFQRETMLMDCIFTTLKINKKDAVAAAALISKNSEPVLMTQSEALQVSLLTAFKNDPMITAEDKKPDAPWVKRMIKRISEINGVRERLRVSECRIMESFDFVPLVTKPFGMQTMREEDIPGSPAWELKWAMLREAAARALRPPGLQAMITRELVSAEFSIKAEMRRCGFEHALGVPKGVTGCVENILGCTKEVMVNLDLTRVDLVSKFTTILEALGEDPKVKAIDLGNQLQMIVEHELDDGIDNIRAALGKLKSAVMDELKPRVVEALEGRAITASNYDAQTAQSIASQRTLKEHMYIELINDISQKALTLIRDLRVDVVADAPDSSTTPDPVLNSIRALDYLINSAEEKHKAAQRSKSKRNLKDGEEEEDADSNLTQVSVATTLVVLDSTELLNTIRSLVGSQHWPLDDGFDHMQTVLVPTWMDVLSQLRRTAEWCKSVGTGMGKYIIDHAQKAAATKQALLSVGSSVDKEKSIKEKKSKVSKLPPLEDIPVVQEVHHPPDKKKSGKGSAVAAVTALKASAKKKEHHSPPASPSATSPPPPAEGVVVVTHLAGAEMNSLRESAFALADSVRQVLFRITNAIVTKSPITFPIPENIMDEAIGFDSLFGTKDDAQLGDVLDVISKVTDWADVVGAVLDPSQFKRAAAAMQKKEVQQPPLLSTSGKDETFPAGSKNALKEPRSTTPLATSKDDLFPSGGKNSATKIMVSTGGHAEASGRNQADPAGRLGDNNSSNAGGKRISFDSRLSSREQPRPHSSQETQQALTRPSTREKEAIISAPGSETETEDSPADEPFSAFVEFPDDDMLGGTDIGRNRWSEVYGQADPDAVDDIIIDSVVKMYPRLSLADADIANDLGRFRRQSVARMTAPKTAATATELCFVLSQYLGLSEMELPSDARERGDPNEIVNATLLAVRRRQEGGMLPLTAAEESGAVHRLEMMLKAAEATVGQLMMDRDGLTSREGRGLMAETDATARAIKWGACETLQVLSPPSTAGDKYRPESNTPLDLRDRRMETPPIGPTFRKISSLPGSAMVSIPRHQEHCTPTLFPTPLSASELALPQQVAEAHRSLEDLTAKHSSSQMLSPKALGGDIPVAVSSAMHRLASELSRDERTALIYELVGDPVAKLHHVIIKLLNTQIFRRLKMVGAVVTDPFPKRDDLCIPNIPELLRHDLSVVSGTLDVLEQDSQHVVEKIKLMFSRVHTNIMCKRIKRAREAVISQYQGFAKTRHAEFLRCKEETLQKELLRLVGLREQVRNKQLRNWKSIAFGRRTLTTHKVSLFVSHNQKSELKRSKHALDKDKTDAEAAYMAMFLARVDRWFQYKRASMKHSNGPTIGGASTTSPTRPVVTVTPHRHISTPAELTSKPLARDRNMLSPEVARELGRKRLQGYTSITHPQQLLGRKPLSSQKLQHPSMLSIPIISEHQRQGIERLLQATQVATATPPLTPFGRDLQLPDLSSPPTRQSHMRKTFSNIMQSGSNTPLSIPDL